MFRRISRRLEFHQINLLELSSLDVETRLNTASYGFSCLVYYSDRVWYITANYDFDKKNCYCYFFQVKRECGEEFEKSGISLPDCTPTYPEDDDPQNKGLCHLSQFPVAWPVNKEGRNIITKNYKPYQEIARDWGRDAPLNG